MPFITVVCHANVCRSPSAAQLLLGQLPPAVGVRSGGIRALVGRPWCPLGAASVGLEPREDVVARQLTAADVVEADLVLVMESQMLAPVAALAPGALPQVFTFRQAARLAHWRTAVVPEQHLPGFEPGPLPGPAEERWVWFLEELQASRGLAPFEGPLASDGPGPDDILDPHTGAATHAEAGGAIAGSVARLTESLHRVLTAPRM